MAEKDFIVKNGLQVNGGTWTINSTAIYYEGNFVSNAAFFAGQANTVNTAYIGTLTANNSSFLGGVAASSYLNITNNVTISGNLDFTAANLNFSQGFFVGSNVVANTKSILIGNSTVNTTINSTGFFINGGEASGGYYKGNDGEIGNVQGKNNLYRINSNTQTADITINSGENALTVGPMVINSGISLEIATGGRVVII